MPWVDFFSGFLTGVSAAILASLIGVRLAEIFQERD